MESVGLLQFDSLGFDRTTTSNSDATLLRFDPTGQLLEETQCENKMPEKDAIMKNNKSKSQNVLEYQRGNSTSFETLYVGKRAASADTHAEQWNETALILGVDSVNLEWLHGKGNRIPFLKLTASSSYDDGDTYDGDSAVDFELLHVFPIDDCTERETECRSYSSVSATPQPSSKTKSGNDHQKCSTHIKVTATEELTSVDSHSAGSPLTNHTSPDDETMSRSTAITQRDSVNKKAKGHQKYRLFLKKFAIRMKQPKSPSPKLFASLSVMFGCKSGVHNQVVECAHEEEDSHVLTNQKISTVVEQQPHDEEKSITSSSTRPHPIEVTLVHSSRQLWLDENENDKVLLIDSIIENTKKRSAQLDSPIVRVGGPVLEKRMLVRNLIPFEETFDERRQLEESIIRVLSQSSRRAIAAMRKFSFSDAEDDDDEDDDSIVAATTNECFKQQTFYHDSNGANWTQKQNFCNKVQNTMRENKSGISQEADEDAPDSLEPAVILATTINKNDQNHSFKGLKSIVENKLDPVWDKEEIISEIKITGIRSLNKDDLDSLLAESEDNYDPTEAKEPVKLNYETEDVEDEESVGAVMRGGRTDESVSDLSEAPSNIQRPTNVDKQTTRPSAASTSNASPPPPPKDHQSWRTPFADWSASDIFCRCDSEEPPTVNADIIAAAVAAAAAANNQHEHKCMSFRERSEIMRMIHTEIVCLDSCFDACTSIDTSDNDEDDESSGILTSLDNDDDDEKNFNDGERDSVLFSDTGSSRILSDIGSSRILSDVGSSSFLSYNSK